MDNQNEITITPSINQLEQLEQLFKFNANPLQNEQKPACNHRPGKFLGQSFSNNYERYQCADCNEEFSRYIENR